MSVFVQQQHTVCDFAGSDSWVILSPIEQSIKRKIEAVGTPLKDWDIQINYGIKTGYNEAFIISTEKRNEILSHTADYVAGQAEEDYAPTGEYRRTAEIIRPILRGRDIKRYGYNWANLWLIATFPSKHYDIAQYPAVKDYLLSEFGMARLEQTGKTHIVNGEQIKARKRTNNKWFETQDSISYWNDFNQQKIVYGQFQDDAEYAFAEGGVYVSSNEYILICRNYSPKCLLAFLNSAIVKWLLDKTTGNLGGNAKIGQKSNFVKLSIPILEKTEQVKYKQLVDSILSHKQQNLPTQMEEQAIDDLCFNAYDISPKEKAYIQAQ